MAVDRHMNASRSQVVYACTLKLMPAHASSVAAFEACGKCLHSILPVLRLHHAVARPCGQVWTRQQVWRWCAVPPFTCLLASVGFAGRICRRVPIHRHACMCMALTRCMRLCSTAKLLNCAACWIERFKLDCAGLLSYDAHAYSWFRTRIVCTNMYVYLVIYKCIYI